MEDVLKKEKKEFIKKVFSIIAIVAVVSAIFVPLVMYTDSRILQKEARILKTYGQYAILEYEEDGKQVQAIRDISDSKTVDGDKITIYIEGNTIYLEKGNLYESLVLFPVMFIILFMWAYIYYRKHLKVIKNGELVTTDIVKNSTDSLLLKWENNKDGKTYYFMSYKDARKNYIQNAEKCKVYVNPNNPKEFYVVA